MLYLRIGRLGYALTGVLALYHRDTLVNPVSPSIWVPAAVQGRAEYPGWDSCVLRRGSGRITSMKQQQDMGRLGPVQQTVAGSNTSPSESTKLASTSLSPPSTDTTQWFGSPSHQVNFQSSLHHRVPPTIWSCDLLMQEITLNGSSRCNLHICTPVRKANTAYITPPTLSSPQTLASPAVFVYYIFIILG